MGQLGYTPIDLRFKEIARLDLKSLKKICHEERQVMKAV